MRGRGSVRGVWLPRGGVDAREQTLDTVELCINQDVPMLERSKRTDSSATHLIG